MRVLIAGGGTGGHLFPGMALAEEIVRRGGEVRFVGGSRGIETRAVPAAGYALETLEVSGLVRMGFGGTLRGLFRVPCALVRSFLILRRFRPDVVVGVGGYASGPMLLAAVLAGYATAVQEQNSVPGFTNRVLGKLVAVVFVAFEDAAPRFPARKLVRLGNPVRGKIVAALEGAAAGPASSDKPRVLVVGGSQGARAVNELVVAAAPLLVEAGVDFSLVHQTGAAEQEKIAERYRALGLGDRVTVTAFIDDMAAAYAAADLVIARAGALTLAELAIAGKPAILIPLPTAADDHQSKNAARFAAAGAAVVLDQRQASPADLAARVRELAQSRERRAAMRAAMRGLARPRAAQAIVDHLEALTRGR
ncbi:MAG: undecaprenyldiphospho-muramoylpentapeptide beta-N-acetylglucosaminyltransferase [Deltaproteobacteria bacterium]|nr:undecaprenyldiphospho-muramoylpentapeptide beta-N-acetylglucosaminyltransferase [Deltaproteobacteria bacterium]